jgi:hypothetical protein
MTMRTAGDGCGAGLRRKVFTAQAHTQPGNMLAAAKKRGAKEF